VELVKEGLAVEGLDNKPEYVARAKMELDDIKYLKSEDYFLTLQKVFKLAENRTLPGSGRGSGAGSLVNYLLGITHVDPLKYDLLWERFMGRHRCLDPETLVKMSDGTNRPIANVSVGDEVVSGNNRTQKVKSKFVTMHRKLMKITIGDQTITCSPNHRWIVLRNGLEIEVLASEIQSTDLIRKL
jgi:hypothetical protein